jgi:uncharacterized protein
VQDGQAESRGAVTAAAESTGAPCGEGGARGSEPYAALAETHAAVVIFIKDRAYKLKKPVDLGFLDFSTLEARAVACHREAELNRRFAPGVYLGWPRSAARLARSAITWW